MALLKGRTVHTLAVALFSIACLAPQNSLATFDKGRCKLEQYHVDEAVSKAYQNIDAYLKAAVKSDDPKANSAPILQWLKIEKEPVTDIPLVTALERFTSLARNKCDLQTHTLLMQHKCIITPSPLERVEAVVKAVAANHAKDCNPTYKKLFAKTIKKMKPQTQHEVEIYMDRLITQIISSTSNPKAESFMELTDEHLYNNFISKSAKIAYKSMESLSNEDGYMNFFNQVHNYKKGKLEVSRIMDLYKLYLIDSCEEYVKELSSIFLPAELDSSGEPYYDNVFKDDFNASWARFRLCQSLITNDQTQLKKDIIAVAKEAFDK